MVSIREPDRSSVANGHGPSPVMALSTLRFHVDRVACCYCHHRDSCRFVVASAWPGQVQEQDRPLPFQLAAARHNDVNVHLGE